MMGLVWHLFWYRQLCSFLSVGPCVVKISVFRQQPVKMYHLSAGGLGISRVPHSDGFGMAFVLI